MPQPEFARLRADTTVAEHFLFDDCECGVLRRRTNVDPDDVVGEQEPPRSCQVLEQWADTLALVAGEQRLYGIGE